MHADASAIASIMATEYPVEKLVAALRGRSGGLRPSKPSKDGLVQYVWRMARFHSGHDASMPVTATWDLDPWLKAHGFERIPALSDERSKAILEAIEKPIDEILIALGCDPMGAARRWGRALGLV